MPFAGLVREGVLLSIAWHHTHVTNARSSHVGSKERIVT